MERTSGNQKGLAVVNGDVLGHLENAAPSDRGRQLLRSHARHSAGHDLRIVRRLQEIPRLSLAELAGPHHAPGLLVVGMDLHGQPVGTVEELDQEREAGPETFRDRGPQQRRAMAGYEFVERPPAESPARNAAWAIRYPGLANRGSRRPERLAAPDAFAVLGLECEQVLVERVHGCAPPPAPKVTSALGEGPVAPVRLAGIVYERLRPDTPRVAWVWAAPRRHEPQRRVPLPLVLPRATRLRRCRLLAAPRRRASGTPHRARSTPRPGRAQPAGRPRIQRGGSPCP